MGGVIMIRQFTRCPFQLHPIESHAIRQALCHLCAGQATAIGYLAPTACVRVDKELRNHAQDERRQHVEPVIEIKNWKEHNLRPSAVY